MELWSFWSVAATISLPPVPSPTASLCHNVGWSRKTRWFCLFFSLLTENGFVLEEKALGVLGLEQAVRVCCGGQPSLLTPFSLLIQPVSDALDFMEQ